MGGDSSVEALKQDASDDDKDHEIANLRYQLRQSIQQQQVGDVVAACQKTGRGPPRLQLHTLFCPAGTHLPQNA